VACQQWANNGKTVVYHEEVGGHWRVMAVDVPAGKPRVLATDRQIGYCSPTGRQIPIYGCHWNPGPYKDLELVDCVTGEIRTAVKVTDAVNQYKDWVTAKFGTTDISVFFPVMSPDEKKIFFKPNRPTYSNDFHGMSSSYREGKIIYDLEHNRFLKQVDQWGHPSWTPDSTGIFEKGNYVMDVTTGKTTRFCPSCISDHVNVAPNEKLFTTDADVTKRPWGKPGYFAVAVGSMSKDDFVVLTMFDNTKGAKTWRKNHPHPTFSADGKRLYFNTNDGPWTRLMVAEIP
jgi:Tol biopolymer transport system component